MMKRMFVRGLRQLLMGRGAALLVLALVLPLLVRAAAPQTFPYSATTVYSFPGSYSGSLNGVPFSVIAGSDGNFYGTQFQADDGSDCGKVYRITPAGQFTVLHAFVCNDQSTGAYPTGKLVEGSDHSFYGVATRGGSDGEGLVYRIAPDGSYSVLYAFTAAGAQGAALSADFRLLNPLQLGADGNLYGLNGNNGPGCGGCQNVIYRVTTAGAISTVGRFDPVSDGPVTSFFLDADGAIYGTTRGTPSDDGSVFRLAADGSITHLYTFHHANGGEFPDLLLRGSDGNFYGHFQSLDGSGSSFDGIFELTLDGSYSVVHVFTVVSGNEPSNLRALVRQPDGHFRGLAASGGSTVFNDYLDGVVFDLAPDGTVQPLYAFPFTVADGQTRGSESAGDLVPLPNGSYYGVTYLGGIHGTGSVYTLSTIAATPAPTVSLSADPATVSLGQGTTLSWSSTNATSCLATGAWSGSEPISGSQTVTPSETGNASYILLCSGAGGSTTATATVAVNAALPAAPTVTITVNPATITVGQSAALSWSSSDAAATCTASGAWTGSEPASGSQSVSPSAAASYGYTLSCSNAGGSGSATATLTVQPQDAPPPPPPPPPAPGGSINGHAGGGVGLDVLIGLGIMVLLRQRRLRAALAMAAGLWAMSASAQEAGGWPVVAFDPAHAYVGLRGGTTTYGFGDGRLERGLAADGDAVSDVHLDRYQVGGGLFAGIPVYGPVSIEAGFVDLGRYGVHEQSTGGDISKTAADTLHRLPPAGRGGTLGLAGLFDILPWLAVEPRAALLIYDSKQEVDTSAGRVSAHKSGAGFDAGGSMLLRLTPSVLAGVGYDCFHTQRGCDVQLFSAQVEYRFGR